MQHIMTKEEFTERILKEQRIKKIIKAREMMRKEYDSEYRAYHYERRKRYSVR